ncbi:MAG: hypothetical protein ABWY18_10470 [Tardiphaga sp.]
MIVLLIAGMAAILAGLAAIGFGIPVKEFGFGNTLILTGTVGVCTGLIILGMAQVLRELKKLAVRPADAGVRLTRRNLPLPPFGETDGDDDDTDAAANHEGPSFTRDRPAEPPRARAPDPAVPPWQDEVLRDRERLIAAEEKPEEPKRRNLLFESSRRERAAGQESAAAKTQRSQEAAAPKAQDGRAAEGRDFEDAWPQAERPRSDAIRRAARAPLTPPNDKLPDAALIPDRYEPPAAPETHEPDVVVVKSGVVDNMAYSLYSDGSIEADMPEGTMRFASIDDLRDHLENRG